MKKVLIIILLICLIVAFFALGFFLRDIIPINSADDTLSNIDDTIEVTGFYYTEKGTRDSPCVIELREDGTCGFDDKSLIYYIRREGTWHQEGEVITILLPEYKSDNTKTTWEARTETLNLVDGGLIWGCSFFEKK